MALTRRAPARSRWVMRVGGSASRASAQRSTTARAPGASRSSRSRARTPASTIPAAGEYGPGGAKGWNGPYIDPDPKDPWGNSYKYDAPIGGGKFKLTCYGEDGAPSGTGEAQDITTENLNQISTNTGN